MKSNKPTKAQIDKFARELRKYLLDRKMWVDTTIYFNGKAFSTDDRHGRYYYNDPHNLIVLENEDPHRVTDYAGDILTMTFEGPLYDALNCWSSGRDGRNRRRKETATEKPPTMTATTPAVSRWRYR